MGADSIVGLSFETTASNSGWQNGACVKVEVLFEKKLFYFACRHHILERLQSAAWQALFGRTHITNNEYFKEFQERLDFVLDKDDFKCLDVKVRNMKLQQDSAISIFKEQLKNKDFLLRDDYKECKKLMLILLGEIPDEEGTLAQTWGLSLCKMDIVCDIRC